MSCIIIHNLLTLYSFLVHEQHRKITSRIQLITHSKTPVDVPKTDTEAEECRVPL